MKILIAVPCMDQVAAPFAQSLATLNKVGECSLSFMMGSLIYESRNDLAKQAVKGGYDYVLWLDSDMIFPPDTMERMMKHMEEGKDIVSGLYFRRAAPFSPVLFKDCGIDDKGKPHHEGYNDYPKDSVFEIEGIGFGCVMVKVSVLLDMALKYHTWFNPVGGFGEDLSFCIRAREMGYKIYCDSTLKCGHVGHLVVDEEVYKTMEA